MNRRSNNLRARVITATIVLTFGLAWTPAFAQIETVSSPDGSLELLFELDQQGQPSYSVTRFGAPLIERSQLGIVIANDAPLTAGLSVEHISRNEVDMTWTQVWGESARVRDHHNEMRVALTDGGSAPRLMVVVFRVFDDGFGFRYEWPEQPHLDAFEITDEVTQLVFAGDHDAWWIPAFGYQRYEYLYEKSPLSELGVVHTPLTMETSGGLYLSVHEAALTNFASMTLKHTGGTTLEADLVPWSDGIKVRVQTPHVSPWRTVIVADTPGGLITSNLVLNLNEPNAIADVSWIKPGKYVGVWWAMHLGIASWGTGPTHGATTDNVRRYIDFAAEHGFDGVLVEGWNVGWDGPWAGDGEGFSFTEPVPAFDMVGLSDYAIDKGVRLIGHHENGGGVENYERQLDDALAYYNHHGITAVKSGYVEWAQDIKRTLPDGRRVGEWHHGQFMVRHYRKVVEAMAEHKIMLDVHEPIKPTGIRRTYPNMMTREGARGQEYNSTWGGGNGLDHNVILPFTRLLAGPMDFTPGIFDLDGGGEGPENAVESTLAHQLALYVVMYSPLQMAADLPANYEARLDAFQFIKDVSVDWDTTVVLDGRIGDYLVMARRERDGEAWFLGAITDGTGRSLPVLLSFLDPDKTYTAQIYADAADAHWDDNPEALVIEERTLTARDVLRLRLAPGGGTAIRFVPVR